MQIENIYFDKIHICVTPKIRMINLTKNTILFVRNVFPEKPSFLKASQIMYCTKLFSYLPRRLSNLPRWWYLYRFRFKTKYLRRGRCNCTKEFSYDVAIAWNKCVDPQTVQRSENHLHAPVSKIINSLLPSVLHYPAYLAKWSRLRGHNYDWWSWIFSVS